MQREFRSLDEALADLLAAHQLTPDPKRVLRIQMLRAEIEHRKMTRAKSFGHVMEDRAEAAVLRAQRH